MTIKNINKALSLLEVCCGKDIKIISINSNVITIRQNDEIKFWQMLEDGGILRLGID